MVACFWGKIPCMGSSMSVIKNKCYTGSDCGFCKKCGTVPCCCKEAEIVNVTRTYIGPHDGVDTADEYIFIVEGAGLTSSAITNVVINAASTSGGVPYDTQTYPNMSSGKLLVYSISGYTISIPFTTVADVGQPDGPLTAGNMSPLITFTLVDTTLTLNIVIPTTP